MSPTQNGRRIGQGVGAAASLLVAGTVGFLLLVLLAGGGGGHGTAPNWFVVLPVVGGLVAFVTLVGSWLGGLVGGLFDRGDADPD